MAGNENSGRPPTPTHLKLLKGTLRRHRHNKEEPKTKLIKPKPPSGLHPEVKKMFIELSDTTYKMGVLSEFDGIALELAATAIIEYRHASRVLLKDGPDLSVKIKGQPIVLIRRSELSWSKDSFRRASSMLAKFGLTPTDRTRVNFFNIEEPNPSGNGGKWDNLRGD